MSIRVSTTQMQMSMRVSTTQDRTKINPRSTVCGTISTRHGWNWICRRGRFVFAREARTSRLTHNILK
eukprot:scaffold25288_cov137-Amphora_coffeaeformis.AAC.1